MRTYTESEIVVKAQEILKFYQQLIQQIGRTFFNLPRRLTRIQGKVIFPYTTCVNFLDNAE